MSKLSAGILLYKEEPEGLQVMLVHPGGPFFRNKDEGHWSIPKGLVQEGEEVLAAARRELAEETGIAASGPFIPLGEVRLKSGKPVAAWASRYDGDLPELHSNTFELEWPPKSGRKQSFPEADRMEFFTPAAAAVKLKAEQRPFLERLKEALAR